MKRKNFSHLLFHLRSQRDAAEKRTSMMKAERILAESRKLQQEMQQLLDELDKKYNLSKD